MKKRNIWIYENIEYILKKEIVEADRLRHKKQGIIRITTENRKLNNKTI